MAPTWLPLFLLPHIHRAVTEYVDAQGESGEKTLFVISDIAIGISRGEADEHGATQKHAGALALTNRRLVAVRMGRFTSRPIEIDGAWERDQIAIEFSDRQPLRGGVVAMRMGDGTYLSASFAPRLHSHFDTLLQQLNSGRATS